MEWNGPTADIGRKYKTLHSNCSRHTNDRFVCVCLFVILWQIMAFKWTGIPPKQFQCLSTFAVALTTTQLSARTGDKQRIKQRIIHTQEFKKKYCNKGSDAENLSDFDVQAYTAHSQQTVHVRIPCNYH